MKTFTSSLIIAAAIFLTSFATLDGFSPTVSPSRTVGLGDGLSVKGPSEVQIGEPVIISPVASDSSDIAWTILSGEELIAKQVTTTTAQSIIDDDLQFVAVPVDSLIFKASKTGTIRIQCMSIDWDARKFNNTTHTVQVAGDPFVEPEPPKPDPDDKDPPKPEVKFAKTDYLVLIEESENRSVETAKIVNSEYFQLGFVRDGYNKPLIKDEDGAGKDFISMAKSSGSFSDVPFFAIMDKDGNFVSSFEMPKSIDELKKELGL